ncbi:hypothetical protein [Thiomicrorhabdus cannonii]|uniref:hypothetical protein n=1 Tax=Thiomicrorhabdus cannonii TaxID=2748011 RepID=UPI0015BC2765|nr:hypothetical protein [Thiomicrorhabdus cannonii]
MRLEYVLAWLPMVLIAIANGAIREKIFIKLYSERTAHQLSSVTILLAFYLYTNWLHSIWPLLNETQAMQVGVMWVGMTVVFEFAFGHFVMHHSWSHLLADYNLRQGRVWSLVLLGVCLMPYIAYRF